MIYMNSIRRHALDEDYIIDISEYLEEQALNEGRAVEVVPSWVDKWYENQKKEKAQVRVDGSDEGQTSAAVEDSGLSGGNG